MRGGVGRGLARLLLVWPFRMLWRLVSAVERAAGIAVCLLLGLLCMAVGVLFTLSIVGAAAGIPLFVLGVLLTARGVL